MGGKSWRLVLYSILNSDSIQTIWELSPIFCSVSSVGEGERETCFLKDISTGITYSSGGLEEHGL